MVTAEWTSLADAVRRLGLGYWPAYRAVRDGRIPSQRLGWYYMVKLEDVRAAMRGRGR